MSILAAIIVVALCAALWVIGRNRAVKPEARKSPAVQTPRSFEDLQAGVKLEVQPHYPGDTAAKRELLRRLQREERRQRPKEGRN